MSEALHPAIAAGRVAVINGAASGIWLAAAHFIDPLLEPAHG